MPQKFGRRVGRQAFSQPVDRQARGIRGDDRVRRDERRDLAIEVVLPLQLLGNRLDDQVATLQLLQMLLVVGSIDIGNAILGCQRRGLQFLEAVDGLFTMPFGPPSFGRKVEEHHRHFGIGKVRGNLRAHHPAPSTATFLTMKLLKLFSFMGWLFRLGDLLNAPPN